MAMPLHAKTKYLAIVRVERGKQRGRSIAFVVVRHRFAAAALHGQAGLCAIESLNLALFIHREDQRVLGRVEIQTDDRLQLFGEPRILADLECLYEMGLQTMCAPNAQNGRVADTDL